MGYQHPYAGGPGCDDTAGDVQPHAGPLRAVSPCVVQDGHRRYRAAEDKEAFAPVFTPGQDAPYIEEMLRDFMDKRRK